MSAADDIKTGLTKTLANFTKQRKAEEKQSSALRWRSSRMREVRGASQVEVAGERSIEVPANLEAKVQKLMAENPDITWHHAVRLIVDPDYTPDE